MIPLLFWYINMWVERHQRPDRRGCAAVVGHRGTYVRPTDQTVLGSYTVCGPHPFSELPTKLKLVPLGTLNLGLLARHPVCAVGSEKGAQHLLNSAKFSKFKYMGIPKRR
eukprot:SAG31_NODE_8867_length_1370_cov_3.715185_2_plen_110_part_00